MVVCPIRPIRLESVGLSHVKYPSVNYLGGVEYGCNNRSGVTTNTERQREDRRNLFSLGCSSRNFVRVYRQCLMGTWGCRCCANRRFTTNGLRGLIWVF